MAFANSMGPGLAERTVDRTTAVTAFDAADLAWERCQERAALAYRAGDPITVSRLWSQGLTIARQHFGRGDPRLAASLTNCALVMRRRQDYQAQRLFREALEVWADSWRWVHLMTPGQSSAVARLARSDQLDVYDPGARAQMMALAERGRAATARLERFDCLPETGLDEWFRIKPRRLTDLRKLLAAVLLIAPNPRF